VKEDDEFLMIDKAFDLLHDAMSTVYDRCKTDCDREMQDYRALCFQETENFKEEFLFHMAVLKFQYDRKRSKKELSERMK